MRRLLSLLGSLLVMTFVGTAQESPSSDSLALAIYNQGTALVRDSRTFTLAQGIVPLNFIDVAATIDPTSVGFKSVTDPATTVLEQSYSYDLVDSAALLARYIDQSIRVTTTDGTVFEGVLLSGVGNSVILRLAGGEVVTTTTANIRNIQFPELPDGLITRPTLRWLLNVPNGGAQQVELTYLAGGINWSADYVVLLGQGALDLNGWVTVTNRSGTTYRDATIKLIAGDVNRLPEISVKREMMAIEQMAAAADNMGVEQRDFFEYKLYEVARPVTLGNNETKQIEFVRGVNVPANTYYVYQTVPYFYGYYNPITDQYYGQTDITTVQTYIEFSTGEENGLGADLPAGRVRVYQQDVDGSALLIGENAIRHTPKGETVSFLLGNAFDLVGERTQTDFRMIARDVIQESYSITLRNRKAAEAVEIRVPEVMQRWSNWEILRASHDYTKTNSYTAEFRVTVPAGGEVTITYTVQYSWTR